MTTREARLRLAVNRIMHTWSMIKLLPERRLIKARSLLTAALREHLSLNEDELVVTGLKYLHDWERRGYADDTSTSSPEINRENSLIPPTPPALTKKPTYDQALKIVSFEFWKGNVKQTGLFKVPISMTGEAALDYFMMNWATIGAVAARTLPTNGKVRLRFADLAK